MVIWEWISSYKNKYFSYIFGAQITCLHRAIHLREIEKENFTKMLQFQAQYLQFFIVLKEKGHHFTNDYTKCPLLYTHTPDFMYLLLCVLG